MSDLVVLCGSLGSTARMWDAQLPVLASRRVAVVDHPGHGTAPRAEVRGVADLAARVLEHAGDERFSFVGVSLGGAVGMRLALDAPERLDRLVLACTSARFGEPSQWLDRAATVRQEGLEAIADAVLARWFTPTFRGVDEFRAMLLSIDPESYARCCEAIARWDVRDELRRIRTPTLVVAAALDPSAPPEWGELIAARVPGARFELLADAAHFANVERPEAFNRLLVAHLEARSGA